MTQASFDDVDLVLRTMATTIVDNADYFAQLDSIVGDGDFGYSLRNGFEVVVADYDTFDRSSIGTLLKKIGIVISGKVGGVSGPIWGTAFLRAGAAAGDKTELAPEDVIAMLRAAITGIMARGGASLGEKTLLDALVAGHRQPRSGHRRSGVPGRSRRGRHPARRRRGGEGGRGDQVHARDARPGRVHGRTEHRLRRRRRNRDRRDPPGHRAAWREKYGKGETA